MFLHTLHMTSEFKEYCDSRSMTAEAPGNTSRSFLITSFDVDHVMDVINTLKKYKSLTYIIACHEICPTTGRHHNHIYAHFSGSIKMAALIKKVTPHHVDKCRGSPQQCIDYVMKDVTDENPLVFEEGERPHQGKQLTANDLRELSVQEIVETEPKFARANLYARDILLNPPLTGSSIRNSRKNVEVYYLYGPSGCGKSLMAEVLLEEHMNLTNSCCDEVKFKNEFWLGVKESKCAWYDEFRGSHMKPDEFISFIDYRSHMMNVKGGEKRNRYTFIVFTSVEGPDELYRNVTGEPRQQWLRRIHWINIGDPIMQKVLNPKQYI